MKRSCFLGVVSAISVLVSIAQAEVPQMISYQGRLTNPSGIPVADGSYLVRFSIYNDSVSGDVLWAETLTVHTSDGLFDAQLGSVHALLPAVFSEAGRWLGIGIAADPELSPRSRFLATPYTLYAMKADTSETGGGWTKEGNIVKLVSSSDLVGIGTDDPHAQLHLGATTSSVGLRLEHGPGSFKDIEFRTDATRDWVIRGYADAEADGSLLIWAVTGHNVWFSNTQVGIGTNNPQSKLDVRGSTNTESLKITNEDPWPMETAENLLQANINGSDVLSLEGVHSGLLPNNPYSILRLKSGSVTGIELSSATYVPPCDPQLPGLLTRAGELRVYKGGTLKAGIGWTCDYRSLVYADVKSFRLANPDDENTEIWYACVEGPEAAAYIRGTGTLVNGHAEIEYPAHFTNVTSQKLTTITLTPLSADSRGLAVIEKNHGGFAVQELNGGTGNYQFDYVVMAVRQGYDDYQVIRRASN